jgi:hypothetical protein
MTCRLIGLPITFTVGFLVTPLGTTAQLPPKVPQVRFLYVQTPLSLRYEETFQHGLHTFGYVVGQNIAIDERSASK